MGVPTGMGAIEKSCLKQDLRVGVLPDLGSANAEVHSHHPSDRHETHQIELLSIASPARKDSTVNGDLNEPGSCREWPDVDLASTAVVGTVCDPLSVR